MKKVLFVDIAEIYGGQQKYISDIASDLSEKFELFYILGNEKLYNEIKSENKILLEDISYINYYINLKKINYYIKMNNIETVVLNGNRAFYYCLFINSKKINVIRHLPLDAIFKPKRYLVEILTNFLYSRVQKVIFVAEYAKKEMKLFLKKGITIHNGINTQEYINSFEKNNEKIIISLIGRVENHKGQLEAIKVCQKLIKEFDNFELRIIGEGSQLKYIEKYVQKNNLGSFINIVGFSSEIKKHLSESDIFLLPSKAELFPLTILEAMSMSLPIISTKVAGIPEMVRDKENGILIDPINEEELYEALKKLILNKELRRKYGENSRKIVTERFDISITVNKLKSILVEN